MWCRGACDGGSPVRLLSNCAPGAQALISTEDGLVALWAILPCASGLWHNRQYFSAFDRRRSILSCRRHSPEQKQAPGHPGFRDQGFTAHAKTLHRHQSPSAFSKTSRQTATISFFFWAGTSAQDFPESRRPNFGGQALVGFVELFCKFFGGHPKIPHLQACGCSAYHAARK